MIENENIKFNKSYYHFFILMQDFSNNFSSLLNIFTINKSIDILLTTNNLSYTEQSAIILQNRPSFYYAGQ